MAQTCRAEKLNGKKYAQGKADTEPPTTLNQIKLKGANSVSVTSEFENKRIAYYQELDQKIAAELKGQRLKYSVTDSRHTEPTTYSATCYAGTFILFKWTKTAWRIFHKQSNLEVAWIYSNSYLKDFTQPIAKRMIYQLLAAKLDWNFRSNAEMSASVRANAPRIMSEVWNEDLPATAPNQPQRPPLARFLQDIDHVLQTRKLSDREQPDPITQNKVIERAILARQEGIINQTELLNWIDEYFDYSRTETLINASEVLAHYQGRKSATSRWKHFEKTISAAEYITIYLQQQPGPRSATTMLEKEELPTPITDQAEPVATVGAGVTPADPPLAYQLPEPTAPRSRAHQRELKAVSQGQISFDW